MKTKLKCTSSMANTPFIIDFKCHVSLVMTKPYNKGYDKVHCICKSRDLGILVKCRSCNIGLHHDFMKVTSTVLKVDKSILISTYLS